MMTAMPVVTMVPMVATMPTMVMTPAVMTMPTMMAAPMDLRRDILRRMLGGRGCGRVDKRHRLRAVGRCCNCEQSRDSCKSKDRPDVHLHEFSPWSANSDTVCSTQPDRVGIKLEERRECVLNVRAALMNASTAARDDVESVKPNADEHVVVMSSAEGGSDAAHLTHAIVIRQRRHVRVVRRSCLRIARAGNIAGHGQRVAAMDDGNRGLWIMRGGHCRRRHRRFQKVLKLTAPIALHARNDHRSAWAVFLLVMGVADPHRIRTRIAGTAIDRNAPGCAANDPAALRGKFFCSQPMSRRCNRHRLGPRRARRRQHDQACEEANENYRSPRHNAPSHTLVPRQRLRLRRARQHQEIAESRPLPAPLRALKNPWPRPPSPLNKADVVDRKIPHP